MNNWNRVSSFVKFSTKGITPKYVEKSSIIVLNQKCIRDNKIDYSYSQFTDDTINIVESKFIRKGDILMNSTGAGTAGRSAFVDDVPNDFRVIVDSHILILRCSSFYEAQCLSYVLFSYEETLMSFMTGSSGQSELDKVVLLDLKTNLTAKPETQQKIASVLSTLVNKIELNNRINVELEVMAKTIYDYWFVQFDFPNKQGKTYKISGGKMVWNNEIKREIPKGWKIGTISDIADLLGGGTPKTNDPSYWGGTIPFFTPKDIEDSFFVIGTKEHITKLGLNSCNSKLYSKGTIFITARGTVGNVNISSQDMAMNQSCYAVQPKREINYRYVHQCVLNLVKYLKAKASGSVFDAIVSNDFKQTPIVIPPPEIIKQFGLITEAFYENILNNKKQNQHLSSLRDWLLPLLLNGQVKVE